LIHGKHSYRANVSDSAIGTIAWLKHAPESIEDRLRERETIRAAFRARGKARRSHETAAGTRRLRQQGGRDNKRQRSERTL